MKSMFHSGAPQDHASPASVVTRRQFLLSTAALTASLGCQVRYTAAQNPMNVVVFLADSFRADHLGCNGHAVRATPNVDALARDSIVFDRCYSQCCWTKPSIGSLFSGMLPQVHQAGLSDWDLDKINDVPVQMLRPCFSTLAERLQLLGYHTAYFLANSHVQERFGFARGFDHYRFENGWAPEDQMREAIRWLRKEAREPFFLFIHEIDPHAPYTPSPEHYQRLFGRSQDQAWAALPSADRADLDRAANAPTWHDDEPLSPASRGFVKTGFDRPSLSAASKAYRRSLYEAEIVKVDEEFGRLMTRLQTLNLDDRTAVVFTSDHGECFGEHGWYGHANSLHEPEVRVPMILRLPAGMRRRERVPWTVSQFDLHPTLVSLAGGGVAEELRARPLLLSDGSLAVDGHRECLAAHGQPGQHISEWDLSLVRGPWKAHLSNTAKDLAVYNLYDDPGEDRNLIETREARDDVHRLLDRFERVREHELVVSASYGEPAWVPGGHNYQEELSALGYL
ncbi:MAG: sulfatase [FCB group bacterium]|jgi:arylsulfatase A-like enzyme|nr:sulfatase [FCB group bacterium]